MEYRKLRIASRGDSTIGSLGSVLKDVLRIMGMPVNAKNLEMNKWYSGSAVLVTVCSREEPSTCVTAGILALLLSCTIAVMLINGLTF
jgi:spore maturation protein SpmB